MPRFLLPLLAIGLTIAGCVRTIRILFTAYTDQTPLRIIGTIPVEYYIAIRDTSENKMCYSFCSVTLRMPFEKLRYSEHYKTRIENHITNEHFDKSPLKLVLVEPTVVTEKFHDHVPFSQFTGRVLSRYYNFSVFGGTLVVRDWIIHFIKEIKLS